MSELRQDLVSGDWIIMAPERERRPHALVKKGAKKRKAEPKKGCPFEPNVLKDSGNWPPISIYPPNSDTNWKVLVVPNKFPALRHSPSCTIPFTHGPHNIKTGAGVHELVVTRDHDKTIADLGVSEALDILKVMQERYKEMAKDGCNIYTSTWYNWGPGAGATVYHPHYQMLTMPIIPPDVAHSLSGSKKYFETYRRCVHCVMLAFDLKEKKRVIEKNEHAIAFTPYVSRSPFEVRIFPLKHYPHFEKTPDADLRAVAAILRSALKRMRKYLGDPDLNFFIHTAPLKDGKYDYYHWHIEIIPKITILGGFELSTGVEINVVDPEKAAQILKGQMG